MHGQLDNLDRRLVARIHRGVLRQRHLRHADGAGVRVPRRPPDLPYRLHHIAHVLGAIVGSVSAEADVDVHECRLVALEPAGLEGNRAACCGPVCPVS